MPKLSDSQRIGRVIRDRRRARGWSQEDLADVSGMHRTFIGRLERGEEANPTMTTLMRVAVALQMSVVELLLAAEVGGRDRPKRPGRG